MTNKKQLELFEANWHNNSVTFAMVAEAANSNTIPPQKWLWKNMIPAGIVGIIAGRGGVGKSYFTLSLCASLATGNMPFKLSKNYHGNDINNNCTKKILMIQSEDSRDEMLRRLSKIGSYENCNNLEAHDCTEIDTALLTNEMSETPFFIFLKAKIKEMKPDLIILDPFSHFLRGDENSNTIASKTMQLIKQLRTAGGEETTLLIVHHVNKTSYASKGVKKNPADAIRGASALVDTARFALILQESETDANIIEIGIAKSNYMPASNWELKLQRDKIIKSN